MNSKSKFYFLNDSHIYAINSYKIKKIMGSFIGKDRLLPTMGAEGNSVTVSGVSGGSYAAS